MRQIFPDPIKLAVLGAGGLGKAAASIIGMKKELRLCAICDSHGLLVSPDGLDARLISSLCGDLVSSFNKTISGHASFDSSDSNVCVSTAVEARYAKDPLGEILEISDQLDAILIALPNLPNEFIPSVIERFSEANSLVFVDVLKRTKAVELMFELDTKAKHSKSVVMTGCGATPGLLATAAVLAAQSFIKVEKVDIWWGVGIANWELYKATIREDIAHMPGYTLERAKSMTDAQVDELLDGTNGLLELRHMEHADDLLLERVGVVEDLGQVEVGGVMDTRHPKKPVSTTMTLTGITFEGKRSSHKFILGDETTMAANVIGPALGYLKRGLWLKAHSIFGVFGSTEFLPMVVH